MSNITKIVTEKFLHTVNEYEMFKNVETVVVGFSGGADSVCLLHLLKTFEDNFGYNLLAVHVNHGIRGAEAERDQLFAENFCSENLIHFKSVSVDCLTESKITKESLEECGRRLRYEIFNSFCCKDGKIATAHNSNDNAETIVFNLIRGTTVKGLCGIPVVRDNIIRPILKCTRDEIECYCKENQLSFVTDSTNLSDDFTRNKIRHNILTVAKDINPSFLDSFSSLSDNASDVCYLLDSKANMLLEKALIEKDVYDKVALLNSESALCSEAIFKAYKNFSGKCLDNKKVRLLRNLLVDNGRLQLFGNDFAEVKKDYLRFFVVDETVEKPRFHIEDLPKCFKIFDYSVNLEKIENNSKNVHQKEYADMIDCNTVVGNLVLRTREPGDEFTFIKRNVTKSLKKLFTEENIPIESRDKIPVIADDIGIVWVYGFGVTKRCFSSTDSDNIILVRGEYNDR